MLFQFLYFVKTFSACQNVDVKVQYYIGYRYNIISVTKHNCIYECEPVPSMF